ncbi:MAG: hypothetical protein VW713_06355 [Alphaproteobacteria bacterium]
MIVTTQDIETTAATFAGVVLFTPTVPSPELSQMLGFDVRLINEKLQLTGSFKARGACEQEKFEARPRFCARPSTVFRN